MTATQIISRDVGWQPGRAAHAAAFGRCDAIAVLSMGHDREAAIVRMMRAAGLAAKLVDEDELAATVRDGTATAAVVTEALLPSLKDGSLMRALADQPTWSDLPFVVVAEPRGQAGARNSLVDALPNVVVVGRPLRGDALITAASFALRARQRQRSTACEPSAAAMLLPPRGSPEPNELLYSSRLSAMGAMASTLAHELNQPLSTVANYVVGCRRLLARVAGDDVQPLVAALAAAEAEAMRAGDIVRRMRELVAAGEVRRQPESLITIIEDACRIALIDAPATAIDARGACQPIEVMVDRVAIQHVIVNLVRSGIEGFHGGAGRRMVIATRRIDAGLVEVRITDLAPAEEAGGAPFSPFDVHDPDDARVWLAICRTIVESHGGAIDADGLAHGGATIAFTLPIAAQLRAAAA